MTALTRITAQLACLAEETSRQGKPQLEATLTRTAAEQLTSMTEIATSDYGAALIQGLITRIEPIEDNLLSGKSLLRPALTN